MVAIASACQDGDKVLQNLFVGGIESVLMITVYSTGDMFLHIFCTMQNSSTC